MYLQRLVTVRRTAGTAPHALPYDLVADFSGGLQIPDHNSSAQLPTGLAVMVLGVVWGVYE